MAPTLGRKNSRFYVQFVHAGCFTTRAVAQRLVLAGCGAFLRPGGSVFLPGIGAATHTVLMDTRPQMADNGRDAKEADYGALSLYPDRP